MVALSLKGVDEVVKKREPLRKLNNNVDSNKLVGQFYLLSLAATYFYVLNKYGKSVLSILLIFFALLFFRILYVFLFIREDDIKNDKDEK